MAAPPKAVVVEKAGVAKRVFTPDVARNWRGSKKHELDCTVWYPASDAAVETVQRIKMEGVTLFVQGNAAPQAALATGGGKRPLVLLSPASGTSNEQMGWLGIALAHAGYIAVSVTHPGNNTDEPYTAEGFALWWERATDMSEVLDGMLADPEFGPHIDQRMIGAAGISLGGYTVLELAGAQTDIGAFMDECHAKPATPACNTEQMKSIGTVDELMAAARKTSRESLARAADSFLDPRIRAVFAIAPGLTVAQTDDSLHAIHVPVEVVVGADDPIAPPAGNADKIAAEVHGAREFVLPGGIAHYTFLSTCTQLGKTALAQYCVDKPGVDRDAVHAQVSTLAIDFFSKSLKWK